MVAVLSLFSLFVSATLGARAVVRWLGLGPPSHTLPGAIALSTIGMAWCLISAMVLAFPAEFCAVPLVQMPAIAAVSVAGAVLATFMQRRWAPAIPRQNHSLRLSFWPRLSLLAKLTIVLPVVGLHGFLLIQALLRPPAGFDGLYYHLPLMVRWLRAGRLLMVPDVWQFCSPSNCELWQMFFASTGIERIIDPSLLPVGLLMALTIAGIGRELGATATGAGICALLGLTCPIIALQMYSSYVDMFGATFIVGSFYWLLRLVRYPATGRQQTTFGLLSGLSLGVAIGTKLSFLAWAAVVGLCLVVIALVQWRRHRSAASPEMRPGWIWLLAFALSVPICSAYWYARSTYHSGWFLYPMQLNVAGWVIGTGASMDQIVPDLQRIGWRTLAYPWIEWNIGARTAAYAYALDSGLGPPFVTFAIVGSLYLLFRRRHHDPRKQLIRWLVVGFIGLGTVLFVEVCFSYPRYVVSLWAVMIASAAPLIDLLLRRRPKAGVALMGITGILSAAMIALWPAKLLLGRLRDGNMSRAYVYQIPELFDTLPKETVVLNFGGAGVSYPLLGAGWRNEVIEAILANARGLRPPLSASQIEAHDIDMVYARGRQSPPFGPDVVYETIYDDTNDPDRITPTSTQVYRVRRTSCATTTAARPG